MKFTKQDLLTLLIGLFLFSSCKTANTIGFEPEDEFAIKGTLDTILVGSATVPEEVISTLSLPRHPFGFINDDPDFGDTEASLAMAVALPSAGYSFGTGVVIDSAVLTLPYSTQFYGDTTTSKYSFEVRQLRDDLSMQKSFLSNREWPVTGGVLGSYNARIQPKTSFKINDIVTGAADTAKSVVPQIRIKLDPTFIQNNIVNLDSATRSKNARFASAFKGLHVSVNKTLVTGKGGIMFFDFIGADANIEIYYKKQNATTPTNTDTVAAKFPINSLTGPIAATIKHDYTGTPVKTQLDVLNPSSPYTATYLQPMSGVRNKISFPSLKNFITRVKNGNPATRIVVNKAELVINVADGSDVAPYTPAQRLSLYRLDIAGQRSNLPDNDFPSQTNIGDPRSVGSELAYGGFYDTTNKRYVFAVTSYIQDLIDGKTEDYGTYLAASSLTEYNVFPGLSSAARTVINTRSIVSADKRFKLNIYYTKVN